VLGIEDKLITAVDPLVAGDDLRPGDEYYLVNEALHHDVLEGEAGRHRVVVHAIANQPGRRHSGRLLLASLEQALRDAAQRRQIAHHPLPDRLFLAAGRSPWRARHRPARAALTPRTTPRAAAAS